jgi:hypothetical protein
MLSLEIFACIISKAMLKSRSPPTIRRASTLMLNRLRIRLPVIAKNRAIKHASETDFLAILFFSSQVIPLVREMKDTAPLTGSTMTKIEVNA